jgi:hypothetical protein
MFYVDHGPPHFHAEYGEYSVKVEIASGVIGHLREWYHQHRQEPMDDWRLCSRGEAPNPIAPLE